MSNWYGDDHEHARAHRQYQEGPKHEAHLSHELIAGAAAYEAAKAYEQHQAANGKPANHAKAKEIIAGLAGAFIDKEVETHGLDFIDKQKAKRHAERHTEETINQYGGYNQEYGQGQGYNQGYGQGQGYPPQY
ncbi:hypothetical protein DFH94DRAFT_100430 [Russula ochroleuca]|uniref:CipC-like antibiotic response protein n=1 Tax=Russula ochroleuca TaxID=152965 RepID=A0A9P5MS28_9AGAM|nr:hypothetical protein DFH94DRAFT_100430 [Russula ochroleuca]